MPAEKVAKKVAKKAVKKGAKHSPGSDMRRTYEHLGRVSALWASLSETAGEPVHALTSLAMRAIANNAHRDAADLLRAAEHLSFAELAGEGSNRATLSHPLEDAIAAQFEDLLRKADEHWDGESKGLKRIYENARRSAGKAYEREEFHRALEFARAAEALSHVKAEGLARLQAGKELPKLKGKQ